MALQRCSAMCRLSMLAHGRGRHGHPVDTQLLGSVLCIPDAVLPVFLLLGAPRNTIGSSVYTLRCSTTLVLVHHENQCKCNRAIWYGVRFACLSFPVARASVRHSF